MDNITIIIPIVDFNEELVLYIKKAIESVTSQGITEDKILLVGPEKTIKSLNENNIGKKATLLFNNQDTDYCSQINKAVQLLSTKYFSILGFDDTYSKTWFKNVEKHIKYMPEYSIFMPIITFLDDKTKETNGMINEIIWAMSFSNEIGVLDEDALQKYYDFSTNGAVFRTDDFIEIGMLKPSIKLSFWYEFLLRATNQGLKIYTIPKTGYVQVANRDGSIMDNLNKTMDSKEREWWIKLATKEYYFKQERKKSYAYKEETIPELK